MVCLMEYGVGRASSSRDIGSEIAAALTSRGMPTIASHAIAPRPPKNERPRSATASAAHFFAAQRAARAPPAAAPVTDAPSTRSSRRVAAPNRVEQRVQAARDREEEQLAAARVPTSPPVRTHKPAPGLAHTSHEEIRQAAEAAAAVVPTAYLSAAPRILSPAGAAAAFAATPRPATADSALHERLWRDSQAWQQRREELYAEGARRRAAAERRGCTFRPELAVKSPPSAADLFARLADDGRVRAERARQEWHAQHRPEPWAREKVTSAPPPPPPEYAVAIPPSRAERRPPARRTLSGCAPRAPPPPEPPPPPSPVPHEWRGGADTTLIAAVVAARDAAAAAMAPSAAPRWRCATRRRRRRRRSARRREAEAAAFEAQEAWWRDEEARKHAETAAWRALAPAVAVGSGRRRRRPLHHAARRRARRSRAPRRTAHT